jgi:hypothetical protein
MTTPNMAVLQVEGQIILGYYRYVAQCRIENVRPIDYRDFHRQVEQILARDYPHIPFLRR